VYDLGREIVTYTNEVDCARIIHELLAASERATSIRTSGYQRARKDHTYEARWTTALETLGALA
jgi:spore maturation protein CgeB